MTTSPELCETESGEDIPRPFQLRSYEDLLQLPDIPVSTIDTPSGKRAITEPLVDAIVVPTIRTAEHLRSAVQFAADTRSSYGFYGKDVDWEEIQKLRRWKRPSILRAFPRCGSNWSCSTHYEAPCYAFRTGHFLRDR